jgi:phosphoribosylamine--glycine ligase
MNILLIGSGGREHALAWKIAQSPLVDTLWCAPGSPAIDKIGPCFDVAADDVEGLVQLTLQLEPDLVVIGPEAPLALGLADILRARGFDVFGPSRDAARLEASKGFSKDAMARFGVPTAAYQRFTEAGPALGFLATLAPPFVLKADGLAAGKGVVITHDRAEAEAEIVAMLDGKHGQASAELVIEAFMAGEEASIFVITDGRNYTLLPAAQDHKRVGEGDTGPNTGGMGAYVPAPVITADRLSEIEARIVVPMLKGMAREGMPYQGVLYVGVMVTEEGVKVVEFNARFGDPECQVLMAAMTGDLVPLLLAASTGGMSQREFASLTPAFSGAAVTVVMAASGYPGPYEKGSQINGLAQAQALPGVTIFHAGTGIGEGGAVVSTGGRVLNVTAIGEDIETAIARAYAAVEQIDWPEGFYRRDIGWRALNR